MAKSHKTCMEQAEIIDTFGTYHSLFTFLGLFCFVCCSNKLDPNLLFCVGDKHAPLKLEHLIGFACLFLSCELFFIFS